MRCSTEATIGPDAVASTDDASACASAPTHNQRPTVSTPLGNEPAERSRSLLTG